MKDLDENIDMPAELQEEVARRKDKRKKERRTEVRGTRLSESEAKELDRRAQLTDMDISSFIRLSCLEDRPREQALKEGLRRVLIRIRKFEKIHGDKPPSTEDIRALRADVKTIVGDHI